MQLEEDYVRHSPNYVHSISFKHKQTTKTGELLLNHPVYVHVYVYVHGNVLYTGGLKDILVCVAACDLEQRRGWVFM